MALKQITSTDLANKGVSGMPDVPGLSTSEMQAKIEEIVRSVVIPAFNDNASNTYDKTEVAAQISQKIIEIGAGDMAKSIYDKNNNGIVDDSDDSKKLGGQLPAYYAKSGDFEPSQYSIQGLSFSGCTYVCGGFIKIGKLIIVNLRINPTTTASNAAFVSGFPAPLDSTAVYVCGTSRNFNVVASCYISSSGALTIDGTTTANQAVAISVVYFSE